MNLQISEELLSELRTKAAIEGKSVDELAEEALRKGLDDQSWQDLLEYGRETGRASGYSEDEVPNLVKQWRREQPRR